MQLSIFVFLLFGHILWAEQADNDYIREQLHGLTRWNYAGATVSSNWYDYRLFDCEGGINNRSCSVVDVKPADVRSGDSDDSSGDSLLLYVQGITIYGAVNIAAIALIIIGTMLFLIVQLCLCAFAKTPDPSIRPNPMLIKSWRMLSSTGCLSVTMAALCVIILLGMILGYGQTTQVYTTAPFAPLGVTGILRGEMPIVESNIISFSSLVVAKSLTRVNSSLTKALDFPQTIIDLEDVNRTITAFPPVSAIRALTNGLETNTKQSIVIIDLISDDITEVEGELSSLKNATATFRRHLAASEANTLLLTDLDTVEAAFAAVSLVDTRQAVMALEVNMQPTAGYIDQLSALVVRLSSLLKDLLPPLDDLFNTQIQSVNNSLVDTTKYFDSRDLFDDFNQSITDSISDTSGITNELDAARITLLTVNYTEYLITIDNANKTLSDSVAMANFTAMRALFQFANYASVPGYNVSVFLADLDSVIASIDDVDLTSIQSTLDSSKSDLQAIDFSSFDSGLSAYDSLIDDSKNFVTDGLLLVRGMYSFLFSPSLLSRYRDQLSSTYLSNVAQSSGTGAVILSMATTFDHMTFFFSDLLKNVTYLNISDVDPTNLAKGDFIVDIAQSFDRVSGRVAPFITPYTVGGPLYYLTQILNSTRKKVVDINDPNADLVITGGDGKRYDDDKVCLTKECFENQKTEQEEGDSMGIAPGVVFWLLFIPLWLILAAGVSGVIAPLAMSPKNACRTCPLHLFLVLVIVLIPLLLVITGLVLPMLLVGSDACEDGISGTAALYMDSYGSEFLCDKLGGKGTLDSCLLSVDSLDLVIRLDYRRIINTLTGLSDASQCTSGVGGDPFVSILQQVFDKVPNTLIEKAGNFTEKQELKIGLSNIVNLGAADLGTVLKSFLKDTMTQVNCPSVAEIPINMYQPVCSDVVGVYGWLFGMLYLACWVLLCCGIPAGCGSLHSAYVDLQELKHEEWRHGQEQLLDSDHDDDDESENSEDGIQDGYRDVTDGYEQLSSPNQTAPDRQPVLDASAVNGNHRLMGTDPRVVHAVLIQDITTNITPQNSGNKLSGVVLPFDSTNNDHDEFDRHIAFATAPKSDSIESILL